MTELPSTAPQEADTSPSSPDGGSEAPGLEDGIGTVPQGAPLKRRPGRPKGLGKVPGSGRKPGTVNKLTQSVKDYIHDKGRPLELLFKISRGMKVKVGDDDGGFKMVYPTMADRKDAARILTAKIAPDLKATEVSGPDGGPIETKAEGGLDAMAELGKRFAFVLAAGGEAMEPEALEEPKQPLITRADYAGPIKPKPKPEPSADAWEQQPEHQRADNRALPVATRRPEMITRKRR